MLFVWMHWTFTADSFDSSRPRKPTPVGSQTENGKKFSFSSLHSISPPTIHSGDQIGSVVQLIDLASNIQSQLCAETESEEENILWFVSGILKGQVLFSQDPGDILKVDVQGKVIETLCVVRVVHADNTASAALLQVLKRRDFGLISLNYTLFLSSYSPPSREPTRLNCSSPSSRGQWSSAVPWSNNWPLQSHSCC